MPYKRRPFKAPRFVGFKRKRYSPIVPVGISKKGKWRRANLRSGGFMGIEKKFADFEVTATALAAGVAGGEISTSASCLNAVAQGDGESNRDGRRYKMKSIHVKGFLQQPGTSTKGGTAMVRMAVVLDTQTNGAEMNAEDCYLATATASQSVSAFRNLQFSGRFKVLYDKTIVMNRTAALGNGTANDSCEIERPFNINIDIPTKYSVVDTTGTTANVSTITDNSLHLLSWCNDTTDAPNIRYESRLRFVG